MIYTVECAFTVPAREEAWNAYYGGEKLDILLSVPGFISSQRFRAITEVPAPYLAIHSVRDASVFEKNSYRDVGGGTFGGWDDLVTNWDRNLFSGLAAMPEVGADQYLVMLDDPAAAGGMKGADFTWLDAAGLDRTTEHRGLAIVSRGTGAMLARDGATNLRVFAPIGSLRLAP